MLLLNFSNYFLEAGTDEAGRGCLAGPVSAAAVILPNINHFSDLKPNLNLFLNEIRDSKVISKKKREFLKPLIEDCAFSFAVSHVNPAVIDKINILNASILGMQEAVLQLKPLPNNVIVDGNSPFISKKGFFKVFSDSEIQILNNMETTSIIKGDAKYLSIAMASILAKTHRDEYMKTIHEEFPMYNWIQNKGYPTKQHYEAIKKYGITKYHRLSFKLIK